MKRFKLGQITSFRNTALRSLSVIMIPLFVAVILFDWHTVQQQLADIRKSDHSTLSIYRTQLENTMQMTDDYLSDTIMNDLDCQAMIFSETELQAYISSQAIGNKSKILLKTHNVLGGFYTYSKPFDCYRITSTSSYPQADLKILRTAVVSAAENDYWASGWKTVDLSDRTVLLYIYVRRHCAIAAMIDPSKQNHSDLENNCRVFYTMPNEKPFAPFAAFGDVPIPKFQIGAEFTVIQDTNGEKYDLVKLPLTKIKGSVFFARPAVSFFSKLSRVQWIILLITLFLLACLPLCWLTLRRLLLNPLHSLTTTLQFIQSGKTEFRVPYNSKIQEVTEIAKTVNTMLDTIQQQKIKSYEQQLEIQHAQLQYLHLQIRPHFFLNCLNLIYSMAEEKKYSALQELTLDFSTYLRSIFQDSFQEIPLSTEISSVESYLHILQAGAQLPPRLELVLDTDATEVLIPPLSILTFVENSIKHSKRVDTPLLIRIKGSLLHSEEGSYLNVSICDNGGGFSPEQLIDLNRTRKQLYTGHQVGISNIRHRFRLFYGEKASISFRNLSEGACVELFLPLEKNQSEGIETS